MRIADICRLIAELKAVEAEFGAKTVTKDLERLEGLLVDYEDMEVEDFVAEVRRDLEAATTKKPATKKPAAKTPPNDMLIKRFADRLSVENHDGGRFESVLAEIASRAVSKAEAIAIANRFLGVSFAFQTKKAAIGKIKARYIQDRLDESKRRAIEEMVI